MPVRKIPLVTGEFYHVFNHGIDYRDIVNNNREFNRLLLTLWFYQPEVIQLKLSQYLVLSSDVQLQFIKEINEKPKAVEVHAFAFMPNHYHLLIKQITDGGISTFIGNFQNSFTKYYNAKHDRRGSLFLTPFRSKHIHTEEQFLHITRYIHLNRYSSGYVSNIELVRTDPHTSLQYYFCHNQSARKIICTDFLQNMFSTREKHWEFIENQADYQRQLDHIKHLIDE